MTCKECHYCYKAEEDCFPCCHYPDDGTLAPCEYEDDETECDDE